MKKGFIPYDNERDSLLIGDELTIENYLDRIKLYGLLELTKDKQGLQYAYALKRIVNTVIEELKYGNVPERIEELNSDLICNYTNAT